MRLLYKEGEFIDRKMKMESSKEYTKHFLCFVKKGRKMYAGEETLYNDKNKIIVKAVQKLFSRFC